VSKDLTRTLLWTAGAAWLVSWFLPVLDHYAGWQAFRATFDGHAFAAGDMRPWEHKAAQMLSASTNIVFVAVFTMLVLGRAIRPGLLIRVAVACFVVNLYWFVQLARGGELAALRAGYYVWMAAYALMIATALSIHRTSRTPTAGTPA
jgi:hypothetical protein